MEYRQRIHIEGNCMEDIFSLPCIVAVYKKMNGSYFYVLNDGRIADIGDDLCEGYDGKWYIT